jgi:hypothetical protein
MRRAGEPIVGGVAGWAAADVPSRAVPLPQPGRGFNRRKQLRAVATRYDELERRYQASLTVASILDWLRARPDRISYGPRITP